MVVLIVITALAHLFMATPYGPTPLPVAREMIRLAELKGDETVYDIGAGDGRLLIEAKRQAPGIHAKGFEIALGIWLVGKLRIWYSRQYICLRLQNALKVHLADADVIFLYLFPGLLRRLESKFDAELRPGTKVISHVFRFPGRKPLREVRVPWKRGEKTVLVYEW